MWSSATKRFLRPFFILTGSRERRQLDSRQWLGPRGRRPTTVSIFSGVAGKHTRIREDFDGTGTKATAVMGGVNICMTNIAADTVDAPFYNAS